MIGRRIRVGSPPAQEEGVPSVVAIPKVSNKPIAYGKEAVMVDSNEYDTLYNWKLLLGYTAAELEDEASRNRALAKCLEVTKIEEIAAEFFRSSLSIAVTEAANINPKELQLIVGIPPTTAAEGKRWRQNYKRRVGQALESVGHQKPKFWPEPFAVFQYLKNLGEIRDVGTHQNVLIVDVGGGTTNVCLIQTTKHGRLARGGANYVPQGVRSISVGGSTLDTRIAELMLDTSNPVRLEPVLPKVKWAKEQISSRLNSNQGWANTQDLANTKSSIEIDNEVLNLTGETVKKIFTSKVWPAIAAIIEESLDEVIGKNLSNPISDVDIAILAGGTCQMQLFRQLFINRFGGIEAFRSSDYFTVPDYRSAVAHGLAIEAAANSRHHKIMPSRVSAFLQEDISLGVGLNKDEIETPQKLQSKSRLSTKLRSGILIESPKDIVSLVGRPLNWKFNVRQKTSALHYKFSKVDSKEEEVLAQSWQRIAKRSAPLPGRQMQLTMRLGEDGFARLNLVSVGTNRTEITHPLDPIDLHDLSGLEGDVFFGLDFGTDNTQVAFVNVNDSSLFEALPNEYRWQPQIEKHAMHLEDRARDLLGYDGSSMELLEKINERILSDYVYHSNRIEGSLLGRGETEGILNSNDDTRSVSGPELRGSIDRIGVMDSAGNIVPAERVVSDHLAAINLRDGFEYVEELAADSSTRMTAFCLKELHALVMKGSDEHTPGKYRDHSVAISQTTFVPPDSLQVEPLIEKMFDRFDSREFSNQSALIKATEAHARFVSIHPFSDGNGRVARLLANYFLWQDKLPGLLLLWENRDRYYDALEECNSRELGAWGDLTDLIRIFCDSFEDTVMLLSEQNADQTDREQIDVDAVVTDEIVRENNVTRLLSKLSGASAALSSEEQYEDWKNTVSGISAEIREYSGQLSRAFRSKWGGSLEVVDYNVIDLNTYRAIRNRQSHSRTWYMKLLARLPDTVEELIFYFGPNSIVARQTEPSLAFTCSLHISRFDVEASRYIDVMKSSWSRVGEITHNGSLSGVLLRESAVEPFLHFVDQQSETSHWFGFLVEDLILNNSELTLSEESD